MGCDDDGCLDQSCFFVYKMFVSYFQTNVICSLLSVKYKRKMKNRSIEAQKSTLNLRLVLSISISIIIFVFVYYITDIFTLPLFRLGNSTE